MACLPRQPSSKEYHGDTLPNLTALGSKADCPALAGVISSGLFSEENPMKNLPIRPALVVAAAALLAGACAGSGMYSEPYALFEAEQKNVPADTRPAFVMKVDGGNVAINRNDPVKPGRREVEVSIPGPPGMSDPDRDTLSIDAKPCTRYFLAARRSSPTARDWKAFVSGTEPIRECASQFAGAR
jgi:hypothetical protein